MKRMRPKIGAWLVLALTVCARPAETIDRVVAVVNAHPILLSELDVAVRRQALLDMRPVAAITDDERRQALDRLINQELIREEMENSSIQRASLQEVAEKIKQIRSQLPGAQEDNSWRQILANYGISQGDLAETIADQIDTLHVIDARLRPNAQVDSSAIARYYRDVYDPEMRKKGARPATLQQVTAQIRTILVEQKLNDLTTSWLQGLRAQAQIRINSENANPQPEVKK